MPGPGYVVQDTHVEHLGCAVLRLVAVVFVDVVLVEKLASDYRVEHTVDKMAVAVVCGKEVVAVVAAAAAAEAAAVAGDWKMMAGFPVEVVPLAAEEVAEGTVAVLQKPCQRGQVEGKAAFLASDFQADCLS